MGCLVTYLLRSLAASMGESPSPNPWTPHKENQQARSVGWAEEKGTKDHTQQPQISTNP